MLSPRRGFRGAVYMVMALVILMPAFVYAAPGVNTQIPFQGVLNNSGGSPVTDGTYDMVFRIYDASSGGTTLWTGTHTAANGNAVTVTNGFFDVLLGSGSGNTMTLDFNDDTYYLGISIEADPEMSPRQRLGAAGYAINADRLDGLHASSFVQASSSATSTLDTGMNLLSGCYAVNGICISGSGSSSDFLSLSDTPSSFTANQILFTNGTGNGLIDSSALTFNGTTLQAPTITATSTFNTLLGATGEDVVQVDGTSFFRASTTLQSIYIGLNAGGSYASGSVALDVNSENVGIGHDALNVNTTGYGNTAVGAQAMEDNTEGYSNVAIGGFSLTNNTTGFQNAAVGTGAMFRNTIGVSNTAFGINALFENTSGNNNTALGYSSLSNNTTGAQNVAVGRNALVSNTTGSSNTGVGYQATYNNASATNTTALGYRAGYGNSGVYSAENNIFIGYGAADDITSGANNNIVIGYDVDLPNNAGSNQLNIGNLIFGTGIDGADQTLSSGSIGIGTSSPYTKLSVAGEVVASAFHATNTSATSTFTGITSSCFSYDGTNCLSAGAGATTFAGLSDTPGSITANQLYFGNSGGSALAGSPSLTFNGTTLQAPTITATSTFNAVSDNGTTSIITLDGGSLLRASSTQSNTYLGIRAGGDSTSGDGVADNNKNNTAVGYEALMSNTTGYRNTALGNAALDDNTTGFWNTGLGNGALTDNTEGFANTSIGMASLLNNTTGDNNVAVGMHALFVSVTGNNNTALGHAALRNNTSATNSVAIGYQAGEGSASHTAQNNIFLGYQAGDSITSGADNNIVIGYDVDLPDNAGSNQLNIGNLIFGTGIDGTDQTLSSGSIGIGTSSPTQKLTVAGNGLFGSQTVGFSFLDEHLQIIGDSLTDNTGIVIGNNDGTQNSRVLIYTDTANRDFIFNTTYGSAGELDYRFRHVDQELMTIQHTGEMIIGSTTASSERLTVVGGVYAETFNATNSTSILELNGATVLTASSTGNNLALGLNAGQSYTNGTNNTAIGIQALQNATTSSNNVAIGYRALEDAEEGADENTAVGSFAMVANTTGDSNTAIGRLALAVNTTGSSNTAIGRNAMRNSVNGSSNVAVGTFTLAENITGIFNTAVGDNALGENTSATNTTALGYRAGRGAVGSNNQNGVFIGNEAGANLTTGDNNIFLGYQAGDAVTSGSNNIVIGYDIDAPSNTGSNQLNIGNLIFGTGIDGNDTTLASGNIGIGTSSPGMKLTVEEDSDTNTFRIADTDGTCDHDPESGGVTVSCSSDRRLKTNIIDATSTLAYFADFHIRDFTVIASGDERTGVVAQEVLETHPEMVHMGDDGFYKVEQPNLWKVVKAIQELNAKITDLTVGVFDTLFAKKIVVENIEAQEGTFEKVTTDEICIEDVCVDADKLRSLLNKDTDARTNSIDDDEDSKESRKTDTRNSSTENDDEEENTETHKESENIQEAQSDEPTLASSTQEATTSVTDEKDMLDKEQSDTVTELETEEEIEQQETVVATTIPEEIDVQEETFDEDEKVEETSQTNSEKADGANIE